MERTQDGLRARASTAPPPGGGAGTRPGVDEFSEDEDFHPLLSVIPDLFVPIPRRGGPQAPPARVEGLRGSWSLTRQPAACGRGTPNRTVATLKRGPSLSLSLSLSLSFSLSIYLSIYLYIYIYTLYVVYVYCFCYCSELVLASSQGATKPRQTVLERSPDCPNLFHPSCW